MLVANIDLITIIVTAVGAHYCQINYRSSLEMTVVQGEQNTDLLECKASCPETPDIILTGFGFKNTKGQDILKLNTNTYSYFIVNTCSNGARHAYYQLNMTWNTTGVFYIQCVVEYDNNITVSGGVQQIPYPCWTGIATITVIDQNG